MADKTKVKGKDSGGGGAKAMNHGVKNINKCANKYDGWGTKKGKK